MDEITRLLDDTARLLVLIVIVFAAWRALQWLWYHKASKDR